MVASWKLSAGNSRFGGVVHSGLAGNAEGFLVELVSEVRKG